MPTPVDWYDEEHSIVKVTITPNSTWEEYYQVIEWIVAEVSKVDHRVDIIFHDDVGMPKGNPMPPLKWGTKRIINLPNAFHTIIAGSQGTTNAFARMVMTTLGRMLLASASPNVDGKQLLFLPSLEEAVAFIIEDRAQTSQGR